ncbi:MAG: WbqC-like protein family protein [Candidatus Accumulibacter regalis]|jgi:WbqC-like protein family.|uniref:WbqC-like protein family protein n=1 Tax=Accumulibacter regalis TaxID=522306 RepID=A0A011QGU6_ACCRE|nr:WbqC family protein [Accumulibacter sp.]EXI88300.1 MAG: WbqC-like protein family protein [Candidatus Accumulibacter regalis]HRE71202.1 WbqC family protein [Accumulibacter sp.]
MKKVAILQSNYIPWKGYFDIINEVDLFIFYDDVQYTARDWRNRNRIKTPRGVEWLTVPTDGSREKLICDVRLPDPRWQEIHWKSLQQCYGKAPFFASAQPLLEEVYRGQRWTHLSQLNQHLITRIARDMLGISTEFADARAYAATGSKQDRIIELLEKSAASAYLSGPAAKSYIDEALFADKGIELTWHDYTGYPEYRQFHPPFEHGVSIFDLLFHTGSDAPWHIWGWRDAAPRS